MKIYPLASIVWISLTILVLTACGGDTSEEPPGDGGVSETRSDTSSEFGAPAAASRPASSGSGGPGQGSVTSTATSEPTPRSPGREPSTRDPETNNPGTSEPRAEAKTEPTGAQDSLAPPDPQFQDQILLQDIYAKMDLDQFAPDPTQPIKFEGPRPDGWKRQHGFQAGSPLDLEMARNHPYLHVFAMADAVTHQADTSTHRDWEGVTEVWLHPSFSYKPNKGLRENYFLPKDPVSYFLHRPWFEPTEPQGKGTGQHSHGNKKYHHNPDNRDIRNHVYGPYRFGQNSPRGVLSESVEQALRNHQHPEVRPYPLRWPDNWDGGAIREWDLGDYLRTPIGPPSRQLDEEKLIRFQPNWVSWDPYDDGLKQQFPGAQGPIYQMPWTRWEIISDQLPIVRITSHNETILPLAFPGQENADLTPTKFSVSFVMAFQNRWDSFQDPNRWIARFEEHYWGVSEAAVRDARGDFSRFDTPERRMQGFIYHETHQHFPNYWHPTDYMQHSIIGPVMVQVHESNVIEPGLYPVQPKVSSWEAPGPIAPDEHILITIDRPRDAFFLQFMPFTALTDRPQPNWPLPGDLVVTTHTGPGTQPWEKIDLSYWDW